MLNLLLYLQCVFHGIRLLRLILKIGCRETINFFNANKEKKKGNLNWSPYCLFGINCCFVLLA